MLFYVGLPDLIRNKKRIINFSLYICISKTYQTLNGFGLVLDWFWFGSYSDISVT